MLNNSAKKLKGNWASVYVNSRGYFCLQISLEDTEDNCKKPNGYKSDVKITWYENVPLFTGNPPRVKENLFYMPQH